MPVVAVPRQAPVRALRPSPQAREKQGPDSRLLPAWFLRQGCRNVPEVSRRFSGAKRHTSAILVSRRAGRRRAWGGRWGGGLAGRDAAGCPQVCALSPTSSAPSTEAPSHRPGAGRAPSSGTAVLPGPAPLRGRRAPASPSVTPCMCACVSARTPRPGERPPRGGGRAPKTKVSCTCRDRKTQGRPQRRVAWGSCRAPGGGSRSPEGPPRPPPGRLSLTLRHVQMELCHGAYVSENQGAEGVALCAVSGGHRPGRARPTDTPRPLRLLPRGSAGFCGIPCAGCVAGAGPFAPGKNHRVVDEFWQ